MSHRFAFVNTYRFIPDLLMSLVVSLTDAPLARAADAPLPALRQTNVLMGFTSWPYGATPKAVTDTYAFIGANANLINEHLDDGVPWAEALQNDTFPRSFIAKMEGRRKNRPQGTSLLLSLTALNMGRAGLADCVGEGGKQALPEPLRGKYFNDAQIKTAYLNYCVWMVDFFKPDYLLTGIEANELLNNKPGEWVGYLELSRYIQQELKRRYPTLPLSESITLHKLLDKNNQALEEYRQKIRGFVAGHDFFAVSFYPFFLGLHTVREFADALEFLPRFSDKPVGIAETGHPAEPIVIKSFKLNFETTPAEQNQYVKTLLDQARTHHYLFVTYWACKDFDELWQTFPDAVKDLGRLWRDTGLVDENNRERPACATWREALGHSAKPGPR